MKKSELKMMIREIVREEVALTMKEVIKEIIGGKSQPVLKSKPKPKKKYFSKNIAGANTTNKGTKSAITIINPTPAMTHKAQINNNVYTVIDQFVCFVLNLCLFLFTNSVIESSETYHLFSSLSSSIFTLL